LPDTSDRVDACTDALPGWQQAIRRQVRQLVHAADPQVTQTIKRTNRPCFVLEGRIPLRRGHRRGPRGDHHRRPCQQDRPHRGHPIRRSCHHTRADRHVLAGHRQRLGGRLARAQSGKQTSGDRVRPASWWPVRVDSVPGLADIVLSSRLLQGV